MTICSIKLSTGLPCPGCGLTRSMSCALHGMFLESWFYHPMGMFFLFMLSSFAIVSLLPSFWRTRVRCLMDSYDRPFRLFYFGFVIVFVGFGVVRAVLHLFRAGPVWL
jgi:hypothetical protein